MRIILPKGPKIDCKTLIQMAPPLPARLCGLRSKINVYDEDCFDPSWFRNKKESNMYNKKYRVEKIEEFNRHNPIYEGMEGCVCIPAYLHVGEHGWFLYFRDDWFDQWPHRVRTSIVQEVEYADDTIIVTTENTRFTFRSITDTGNEKGE